MPTLGHALLEALHAHGAGEIFGIPGDFVLPFFKTIEDSGILPFHTLSHEPAVGFAADAAARFRASISAAVVTWGAGAFNLVNPIAGAYAERSPVVVISGAPGVGERLAGWQIHHMSRAMDTQARVFREITCDQAILDDPVRAPAEIARVLRSAREYSLPVYIELPRDLVGAEVDPVEVLSRRPADPDALGECAEEILARLRVAQRPVVMVDVETRRYGVEDKVAALARALGLPVVTTFMGRGLLSAHPDVVRGTYLGAAGDPAVTALVEDSDGLLLLGVILSDTNFAVSERRIDMRRTMLALSREVRVGHHSYAAIPLDELLDALLARLPAPGAAGTAPPAARPSTLLADDAPLRPSDIAAAVNDLFTRHGPMPMAADMGDCLFTGMEIANAPLVAPGYYAGMGFGVPAGLGAAVATGARPLILVGDGAFQMTGFELGNCRRYGWDPIVIVFNNTSWEMLRVFQPESRFNDLDDWRFAELAGPLGGDGVRVRTRRELAEALARAHTTRGRFQLIEAMLPRGGTSDTLARFVAGFKAARERK
ncbi:Indole-3-pyruvate decarboxylase [Rhodovastum atsumiense]|uniref:Indolepyruvate/phenylpyruvate decarboxylase n=1 Tax=Rhodovastum atsumiense TaxID=504468 RepID=A0A5M6IY73_9PROT|nr:indolepyruvate/phenylpyruvate decarboxylase [Rhodovastum atsumiense]KAA5613231.1 indolepyruvate/phenylpyruvate decarboxylase [Rhodovastum atsumiense]CAH2600613.1 Indole-3-pyruvate decarboxylase [Rhodovastum atsumiense]